MVVFLLAPLVVIAVGSLNENRYLNCPPEGFSLSWYGQLFTDSGWRTSIRYSVTIAATSAALAVLIATPLAYILRTYRIRLAPLLYTMGILPFICRRSSARSGCRSSGYPPAMSVGSRP